MAAIAQPAARPHGGHETGAPLESALGFRLGRVHRMVRDAWAEIISDLGLSPPLAAVLRAVCEWPGSGLRELARHMGTDVMNVRRLADRLADLGLVRSAADATHRQRRAVVPTDAGISLAGEIAARAAAWDRDLSELLGTADLQQLHQLLARLEEGLASRPPGRDPRRPGPRPSTGGAT